MCRTNMIQYLLNSEYSNQGSYVNIHILYSKRNIWIAAMLQEKSSFDRKNVLEDFMNVGKSYS